MTDTIQFFTEKFRQLETLQQPSALSEMRKKAFASFSKLGIPTVKHEEWKYTRISGAFNKDFIYSLTENKETLSPSAWKPYQLPGDAHVLVFVNGLFSKTLSATTAADKSFEILTIAEALQTGYAGIVETYFGHSADYMKDGIHALNTAFVNDGVFLKVKDGKAPDKPFYIYYISDARTSHTFSQPRVLVHAGKASRVQVVDHFITLGANDSFTNHVAEIVVEQDAHLEYYKIQHEGEKANHAGTTHIRQVGKSYTHAVTITLDGAIVRNNLNMVMEADHCESHMYGLYLLKGHTHADNHTIVDNVKPHCYSNEFYKGIMDEQSGGVFNGKIFVRKDAQKTNAYQSNKNVLLTDTAAVNTKPQLEIFADDVKCSHGCTVGRLDEEALFYLRARGISEKNAKSLLLHAFAVDILEKISPEPIRNYVDELISKRLEFNF
jgi:Fe-S cluster assembly protein SufD